MQLASTPENVDTSPPVLTLTAPTSGSTYNSSNATVNFSGYATDPSNMAIHYVQWSNDKGGSGQAVMNWNVLSGDYTAGYVWQMDWNINGIILQAGTNNITLTACDNKDLCTTKTVAVTYGSTGITSIQSGDPVQIFPTLVADELTIAVDQVGNEHLQEIIIMDITGRQVYNRLEQDKNQLQVNMADLANGIYFVQVKTNNNFITKKIMVEH